MKIGVIGGGTAGYMAAIALKRAEPSHEVTVVESPVIPAIGVGEATTPLMVPFLDQVLGIDVVELFTRVEPTWKLGIKFLWGTRPFFNYPFGPADLVEAAVIEQDLAAASLTSRLMTRDRTPIVDGAFGPQSLLPEIRFAYHLDNGRFVELLAEHARRTGVTHLARTIIGVVAAGHTVDHLLTADGERLRFDLYVDATGFRALLIEQALGSPFVSFASTLPCDRAIITDVPNGGAIAPYTTAETMDAGWCWTIPQRGADHRGYVYSSAFLDEEQAIAELRRAGAPMTEPRTVQFRVGRHHDFWLGNVVAIGNAYGFVEPLESTALHLVIVEVLALLRELDRVALRGGEPDRVRVGRELGERWDYLRWFLGLHYKFNARRDTAFWRACRDVDVSGLDDVLARYRVEGPRSTGSAGRSDRDVAFGPRGIDTLLLGQQVPCPMPPPKVSAGAWERRGAREAEVVGAAWPQARALALLARRPDLLRASTAPGSWCAAAGDELRRMMGR